LESTQQRQSLCPKTNPTKLFAKLPGVKPIKPFANFF
jgi:hypothetical protein